MELVIKQLSKTYRNGVKALDNFSLEIGTGMFGLLGPNGAGKSTLMRTIATLQQADEGSISFGDIEVLKTPMELRKVLGYLPQAFGVYPKQSAEQLLDYFAILKGVSSKKERKVLIQEVLELTNLYEVRKKQVSGYSGGMKQRFGIAQLLLNKPKLLIVDEPTAGLDPAERNRFLNVLREVGTANTVIFSTHIVEDVQELCTDMAIINGGKLLQQHTPKQALATLEGQLWTSTITRDTLEQYERDFHVLAANYTVDHALSIRVAASALPAPEFKPTPPTLEDVYFLALNQDQ